MEKLDEESAQKFISALIKSVQTLCHGYLNFQDGVEIIGHINLSVDRGSRQHYILEEKVCKNEENSTLFISNSFHAENKKHDAKLKGKDSQNVPSGNQVVQRHDSSDNEGGTVSSAISSIATALTGSNGKVRTGSDAKDLDSSHSKPNTAKRKASDDNDVRPAKSSHLSSSPSPVSHFLSNSPRNQSGASSPTDAKPCVSRLHSESGAEGDGGEGDLNLAGSVLERVDDHSNSDLPDQGDDSDGDLEVTFIKEEFVEGEQSSCQYENAGGQFGSRARQRGSSESMSDPSLYPVSLHHSAPATFVPSAHDMSSQHYGPSTSSSQPGTSGSRGVYGWPVGVLGSGFPLGLPSAVPPARTSNSANSLSSMATKHTCQFCGYSSPYMNNFKRHMRIHNGQMFRCPFCDMQFNCRWYMQKHIAVKHGDIALENTDNSGGNNENSPGQSQPMASSVDRQDVPPWYMQKHIAVKHGDIAPENTDNSGGNNENSPGQLQPMANSVERQGVQGTETADGNA